MLLLSIITSISIMTTWPTHRILCIINISDSGQCPIWYQYNESDIVTNLQRLIRWGLQGITLLLCCEGYMVLNENVYEWWRKDEEGNCSMKHYLVFAWRDFINPQKTSLRRACVKAHAWYMTSYIENRVANYCIVMFAVTVQLSYSSG
jgi:hypothetical protein